MSIPSTIPSEGWVNLRDDSSACQEPPTPRACNVPPPGTPLRWGAYQPFPLNLSQGTSFPSRVGPGRFGPELVATIDAACNLGRQLLWTGRVTPSIDPSSPLQLRSTWCRHAPPIRGGGLVSLVHLRLPLPDQSPLLLHADDYFLALSLPLTPVVTLSFANIHLPPSLRATCRRATCAAIAAILRSAPPGVRLLAGDFNDTLADSSTWLKAALGPGGCWAEWRCPYPRGTPTNIVPAALGFTAREIDWFLLAADVPYTAAERLILPGISTHLALLLDLLLPLNDLRPKDPCGRRFLFHRARPERLHLAAHVLALATWWAASAGLDSDAIIRYGHAQGTALPPDDTRGSPGSPHTPIFSPLLALGPG